MRAHADPRVVGAEPVLKQLRGIGAIEVAFAARVDQVRRRFVLDRFDGARGSGLQGISSAWGEGLGGRCIDVRRPIFVRDYARAHDITHHYDDQVAQEGLRSVFAIPVKKSGVITDIVYGASRSSTGLSDRVVSAAVRIVTVSGLGRERTVVDALDAAATDTVAVPYGATIRAVADELIELSGTTTDPELARRLNRLSRRLIDSGPQVTHSQTVPELNAQLTPRELDVVNLVSEGCSNEEIARRLGLTVHTAKSYLKAAMAKLGSRTRGEAAHRARQAGLIAEMR